MTITCRDVRANLEDYLTDDAHASVTPLIRDHIWDCHECAMEAKRTRMAIRLLSDGLRSNEQAPAGFGDLVTARIADRGRRRGAHALSRSTMYVIAVVTMTLLMTAVVLGMRTRLQEPVSGIADASVPALGVAQIEKFYDDPNSPAISHRIETTSPSMIATALSAVAGFNVTPVDLSSQGANVVSGCTATIANTPAACTNYMLGGQRISLIQMPANVTLPTLATIRLGTHNVLVGGSTTCHIAIWRSIDSVYILAGNVPAPVLSKMVLAVPNSTGIETNIYEEHALN